MSKKRVILVGGGYSVKEGIELGLWDKINQEEVWSLNFAYLFMPFLPKKQIWYDTTFFKQKVDDMQKLSTQGVELVTREAPIYEKFKQVIRLVPVCRDYNKWDLSSNQLYAGQMGLTGTMALSLAVKEGYNQIYLLGYDFGSTHCYDDKTHFYQDQVVQNNIESSGVKNPLVYLEKANIPKVNIVDYEVFLKFSNVITNVSIRSNLSYFEKITYEEFFKRLTIDGI